MIDRKQPARRRTGRLLAGVVLVASLGAVGLTVDGAAAKGNDKSGRNEKPAKVDKRATATDEDPTAAPTTAGSPSDSGTSSTDATTATADQQSVGDVVVLADPDTSLSDVRNPVGDTTSLAAVVDQIGADDLWAAGYTGDGIDVALIDTGVAPVAELSTTDVFVGPDLSFEGNTDGVAGLDTFGHGTHMAGIIAGRTPGADPLSPQDGDFLGVAPDAGLVSVKVADNTGAVDVSQVIAAIDWVVQHREANGLNIRVLNLSYNNSSTQSYVDDPLSKAVENAWDHGIFVVVSAGNEGRASLGLASPATNPTVLAVSSAEYWGERMWTTPTWAPSGDGVRNPDVLAPGVSIESLRVPGSRIDTEHPGGRVADDDRLFLGSGTSQSAAVVSGAAALLLERRPELTPDEVKQLLTSTAEDTVDVDVVKGSGVIDMTAAMDAGEIEAEQNHQPATGLGSLEAARGDDHVMIGGEKLVGEVTVTGAAWIPEIWVAASESASAWSGEDNWSGSTWSGSTWSGSTWSGSTWSGSTWSGSTWSGSTWSGSTWSGSTWSGSTWSGSTWSGSTWSGSTWS